MGFVVKLLLEIVFVQQIYQGLYCLLLTGWSLNSIPSTTWVEMAPPCDDSQIFEQFRMEFRRHTEIINKQNRIYFENLTKLFKGDSQIGNRWLLHRDQFLSIICEELYGTGVPWNQIKSLDIKRNVYAKFKKVKDALFAREQVNSVFA